MTRQERINQAVSQIVHMFETGDLPQAISRTVLRKKTGDRPSDYWSLGNQLLMLLAGTTDARGYKQWQEVGRHVKKGAKAFYILGPCTRKITVTEETEDGETVEVEKIIITGFHTIPVFRYEDTEGKPLQLPDYSPQEPPPLWDVAQTWGLTVKYGPFLKTYYGYYQHNRKEIMLCTHDASVFFHELAHAAHYRVKPNMQPKGQDPYKEIVAETVAATLCHMYGLDGYIYHGAEYIKYYAQGKNPAKAVMQVLADVEATLNEILKTAEDVKIAQAS